MGRVYAADPEFRAAYIAAMRASTGTSGPRPDSDAAWSAMHNDAVVLDQPTQEQFDAACEAQAALYATDSIERPVHIARGVAYETAEVGVVVTYALGVVGAPGVVEGFGHVALVDAVNGDDAWGRVGGYPFATVAAALAAVAAGDVILLAPGRHAAPAAGIVVPVDVCIEGMSRTQSILERLLATADTTLVTLSAGSCLRTLSLRLTSAEHRTLKGIEVPGAVSETAQVEDVQVEVDNSGAGDVGTSNVCAVHTSGTGAPANHFNGFRRCRMTVRSAGLGAKRAHVIDGANEFRSRNCDYAVHRTGSGAGSYIGIETAHASAIADVISARIDGDDGSAVGQDISQTLGTLRLSNSPLVNGRANALGFARGVQQPPYTWGDSGNVVAGTRYWRFGDGTAGTTEPAIPMVARTVITDLSVRAVTGPGDARTDTFVVRKNGQDTGLFVTLTGAQTTASNSTVSVTFEVGDLLSLASVVTGGSTLADVVVTAQGY